MATLEERIKNLTGDIVGTGQIGAYEKAALNTLLESYPSALSDADIAAVNELQVIMPQDQSPMQPLVDAGFGNEVQVIMQMPMNSPESKAAQRRIIQGMGTGMDIDSFLMEIAKLKGRDGDTTIAHLTEGEIVIPAPVFDANPQAADSLEKTMEEMGIDPRTRMVDSTGQLGGIASINPETGLQEFGFLSKAWKKIKNVGKKIVKSPLGQIAGTVIGGPIGTALTTASKVSSVANALKSGNPLAAVASFAPSGGGIGNLFKSTGAGGNIFSKIGQGISGLISGTGTQGGLNLGRAIKSVLGMEGKTPAYIKAIEDFVKGNREDPKDVYGYDPVNDAYVNKKTGEMITKEEYNSLGEFFGGKTPDFIKGIEDTLKMQTSPGSSSLFKFLGEDSGLAGNLGLAGLAGLLGKLAYEEAKNQKGVPLTPLTTMDPLGRYNIAAEIARQKGEAMPSRVEYGLTGEGFPALSGGRPTTSEGTIYQPPTPTMAAQGGIMAFAKGGSVAKMNEGGETEIEINIEEFPRKDGQIDGPGTETSDDIPAMLSDGEFVMTAKAVRGAGSFDLQDKNGILTLTPNGDSGRDSGTRLMYKLMDHFSKVA